VRASDSRHVEDVRRSGWDRRRSPLSCIDHVVGADRSHQSVFVCCRRVSRIGVERLGQFARRTFLRLRRTDDQDSLTACIAAGTRTPGGRRSPRWGRPRLVRSEVCRLGCEPSARVDAYSANDPSEREHLVVQAETGSRARRPPRRAREIHAADASLGPAEPAGGARRVRRPASGARRPVDASGHLYEHAVYPRPPACRSPEFAGRQAIHTCLGQLPSSC
jgi:hypothetical protein